MKTWQLLYSPQALGNQALMSLMFTNWTAPRYKIVWNCQNILFSIYLYLYPSSKILDSWVDSFSVKAALTWVRQPNNSQGVVWQMLHIQWFTKQACDPWNTSVYLVFLDRGSALEDIRTVRGKAVSCMVKSSGWRALWFLSKTFLLTLRKRKRKWKERKQLFKAGITFFKQMHKIRNFNCKQNMNRINSTANCCGIKEIKTLWSVLLLENSQCD